MTVAKERSSESVQYEPEDRCPTLLSVGVGLQGVMIALAPVVVNTAIVIRAADQSESYLSWAVFAALAICGVTTALQAMQLGRFGTGHVLIMGTAPTFIAVCITALVEGGPSMMASLIVVSSLFQFTVSAWLPMLRRIITPVVSGTVVMLTAATVMQVAFKLIKDVPDDTPPSDVLYVAVATLVVTGALALRTSGSWRLWSPLIGIGVGCGLAAFLGLYEVQRVADATWIGLPESGWPGLDLTPSGHFWALLPVFVVVALVISVDAISGSMVIQQVSRRRPQATDFRKVQGALNVNGVGNLLSGIAGTPPNMVFTGVSASLISITGVAARNIGFVIGILMVAMALLPKATAVVLVIPDAVVGAYLMVILSLFFVDGIRTIFQDGIDFRKAIVVGLAFWIGVGIQYEAILPDLEVGIWGALLGNGMAVGAFTAILMTAFIELTGARRRRLEVELDISVQPEIDAFLSEIAGRLGWNDASTDRLRAAGEETLSSLLRQSDDYADANAKRLIIVARHNDGTLEMEFLSVFDDENLQDRLADLGSQVEVPEEHEMSFRLLRHYASSVRHRKYHGLDIVTVQVEGTR